MAKREAAPVSIMAINTGTTMNATMTIGPRRVEKIKALLLTLVKYSRLMMVRSFFMHLR
jgi:hypothetical protein